MAITPSPSDRTLTQILASSHKIVDINAGMAKDTKSMSENIAKIADYLAGGVTGQGTAKPSKPEKPAKPSPLVGVDIAGLSAIGKLSDKSINRITSFISKLNSVMLDIKDPDKLSSKSDALKSMISGLGGISGDLSSTLKGFKKLNVRQIWKIKKFVRVMVGIFGDIKNADDVKNGADAIATAARTLKEIATDIGGSIIKLSLAKMGIGLVSKTINSIVGIFVTAGEKKTEVDKGAESVKKLPPILKSLAGGISVLGVAAPLAILAIPALMAIGGTFAFMGKFARPIRKGSRAMRSVGMSMIMMGAGILAIGGAVGILMAIHPLLPLTVPVMIMGIGLAFAVAGKMPVAKGALSMGLVGISLLALSAGLGFLGLAVKEVGAMNMLKGIGIVAATGLVFALAGLGPIPLAIGLGAIALGVAGLALMSMGKGLGMFAEATKDLTMDSVGIMLASLGGIGVAFAGIGIASVPILLGSAAALSMGLAMTSIAEGVESVKKANYFKDFDVERFGQVVVGIGGAFAAVGKEGGKGAGGLLGILTGIELGPNNIERGINSVLKANEAMTSIATGLVNFQTLTSTIDFGIDSSGNPKPGGLINTIGLVIGSVGKVFAEVGSMDQTGQSYMKLIFGNDFSEGAVEKGIEVTETSGKALMSMAKGLKTFNDFVQNELGGFGNGGGKKLDAISQGIASVIGTVGSAFSSLGVKGDRSWFDWEDNDAEAGANIAKKYGGILESLATGLGAFSTMGTIPTITGYTTGPNGEQVPIYGKPTSITAIGENLKKFIGLTADVLIQMSEKMDKANGSFKVSQVWHNFTKDLLSLSKAADPFTKFSNAFVNMAGGMKTFSQSFKDMGSPEAMVAFTGWTEALLKLSEAGDESFIDKVKGAVFGKAEEGVNVMYAAGAELNGADGGAERQKIVEAANEGNESKVAAAQNQAILNALNDLSMNITSLRNSLLSQGIDVNVVSVDGNVSIKTIEMP